MTKASCAKHYGDCLRRSLNLKSAERRSMAWTRLRKPRNSGHIWSYWIGDAHYERDRSGSPYFSEATHGIHNLVHAICSRSDGSSARKVGINAVVHKGQAATHLIPTVHALFDPKRPFPQGPSVSAYFFGQAFTTVVMPQRSRPPGRLSLEVCAYINIIWLCTRICRDPHFRRLSEGR
jgi:hypothetical protein